MLQPVGNSRLAQILSGRPPSIQESLQRHRSTYAPEPAGPEPTGYSPQREALFTSILGQGMAPSGPMYSKLEGIGKLAQVISGSIGANRQGQARQEEDRRAREAEQVRGERSRAQRESILAGLLSGGAQAPAPAALAEHPDLLGPVLKSMEPPAPPAPDPLDVQRTPRQMYGPGGETRPVSTWRESRQALEDGFQDEPPDVPEPEVDPRTEPRSPEVFTMPDGSTRAVSSWAEAEAVMDAGGLPWSRPSAASGGEGPYGHGKLTDSQSKTVSALQGIESNMRLLTEPDENGHRLFDMGASTAGSILDRLPLNMGNHLQSPEYQRYKTAMKGIISSILRQESGAAIGKHEEENAFLMRAPQPGDDPATIEHKMNDIIGRYRALARAIPGYPMQEFEIGTPRDVPGIRDELSRFGAGVASAAPDYPAFDVAAAREAVSPETVPPASPDAPISPEEQQAMLNRLNPGHPDYDPDAAVEAVRGVAPIPVVQPQRRNILQDIVGRTRDRVWN